MSLGHRATSCTPSSPPGAEDPGCGCPPGSAGHQGAPSCPPWDPPGQELGQWGRARRSAAARLHGLDFRHLLKGKKPPSQTGFFQHHPGQIGSGGSGNLPCRRRDFRKGRLHSWPGSIPAPGARHPSEPNPAPRGARSSPCPILAARARSLQDGSSPGPGTRRMVRLGPGHQPRVHKASPGQLRQRSTPAAH